MLKGTNEGIIVEIKNIEDDLKELKEKLKNKGFFPEDTDFLLQERDKAYYKQIWEIVSLHGYNLFILKDPKKGEVKGGEILTGQELGIKNIRNDFLEKKDEREEKTLIVKKLLRSGQKVYYEGTVIVIGDVNPGAEVFAKGDIYVFGRARGLMHAGKDGDRKREILALSLEVNQIRIANICASGNGEKPADRVSERAFLDEDCNLIVEEYKWL